MDTKRLFICILLAITSLPLVAQDNGTMLKPNYRRIAKEVKRVGGPYYLDSLQARFDRCDTTLTVDDLRCLYFSDSTILLYETYHRYFKLRSRFGNHAGRVNDAWTQYQMLLTAVWSTGNGSKKQPLHVRGVDDAAFIIASDVHGYLVKKFYVHRRYILLRYVAQDEGDYDVWFYIRK